MSVRVGRPVIPGGIYGNSSAGPITPAISKCIHGVSLPTNSLKKAAAIQEPPPLVFAMLFKSAPFIFPENIVFHMIQY